MSQLTSVCKTVIPLVHKDRKLDFSANSSPTKDMDKHEDLSLAQQSSTTARITAGKMNGRNTLVTTHSAQANRSKPST